jgi:hypothetical protein
MFAYDFASILKISQGQHVIKAFKSCRVEALRKPPRKRGLRFSQQRQKDN